MHMSGPITSASSQGSITIFRMKHPSIMDTPLPLRIYIQYSLARIIDMAAKKKRVNKPALNA